MMFSLSLVKNTIARNTLYNLIGYGIPLIFAFLFIPSLIANLGDERYGILNLSWIVVGYFSFLDFGFSKALTKTISEKIGMDQIDEIPGLFWTTLVIILLISLIFTILALNFVTDVSVIFNISENAKLESVKTFYLLALSIPIVSTMAGLRGFLEAYQKFGSINFIRIILGVSTFLGPLIILMITNSLFWITFFLIGIRVVVWIYYLLMCFKVNSNLKSKILVNFHYLKPILSFSIWITLANILGPIILYSDRIIIGTLISASAITYYATPYEIVSKLMLIPTSLVGVLFPFFASNYLSQNDKSQLYLLKGIKIIFIILYPIIFLIILFAYEILLVWLGVKFADQSAIILKLLSIGIIMNAMSIIPNNYLQGISKPRIPTIINLIEFPIYLLLMWFSIKYYGIIGASFTYVTMATIDVILMYLAIKKFSKIDLNIYRLLLYLLFVILSLIVSSLISSLIIKILTAVLFISVFLIIIWSKILNEEEKFHIYSSLNIFNK